MRKPPTQVAGVKGFCASEKPSKNQGSGFYHWERLRNLPPFHRFLCEEYKAGKLLITQEQINKLSQGALDLHEGDALALYKKYEKWHKEKGLWPNEDALGFPLEEEDPNA